VELGGADLMPAAGASTEAELAPLTEATRRQPLDPASWHQLAVALLGAGRGNDAYQPAANAVQLASQEPLHRITFADVLESIGDHASAIAQFEVALELAPADVGARLGLAKACRAVGLIDDAARCYREVLAAHPDHAAAQQGLATLHAERPPQPPATLEPLLNEARRLLADGQRAAALRAFAQCTRLAPRAARLYYWMGCLLHDMAQAEAALVYYDLAARLDPSLVLAADNAGKVAASLGLAERAERHLRHAQRLQPDAGRALRLELLTAAIHDSAAQIADSRRRFSAAVERVLQRRRPITDPLHQADVPSFYLAYHGVCNRELHTQLARTYLATTPSLAWRAPHRKRARRGGTRIRIGFISRFMHQHSIGKTTRGLIAQLNRSRFEVYAINIPPGTLDHTAEWIRARADHWLTLPADLDAARAQLAALELDILFYQDIGLEPFSYFLSFARLAPVQCVSFGHPDTTGVANVDYFISSDLYEVAGAAEHYSERLVQLHDLPTLAYYYRPQQSAAAGGGRARFGWRDNERLYLCPQTLFKLHPDFDRLIAGILERDGDGRVLLIASLCNEWSMRLQRRFTRHMGAVSERIQFVPRLDTEGFMQLLAAVDVVLDTVHFNGMNTSLEAFAVGTPVVTLPGELQRARHTQAMYRHMEIEGCVAANEQHYVEIAVQLASDRERRRALQAQILERNAVLFEDARVVREFEAFFEEAHCAAHERA
jgi:protein O-GlcNAc transferase